MNVEVIYVIPVHIGPQPFEYALRFIESYYRHPPGMEHKTTVVLNGGQPTSELTCLFSSLQNMNFLEHDDSAWDIGAFQKAAGVSTADLLVFFGTSVYFKTAGWLRIMVNAAQKYGLGLYGTMGNRGIPHKVWPHVRTTGFWIQRELFNRYPHRITHCGMRYEFEHGKTCIAEWIKAQGLKTRVVTRTGVYLWENWDEITNGYHRGDQSAMLCGDRLTTPPYYPVP